MSHLHLALALGGAHPHDEPAWRRLVAAVREADSALVDLLTLDAAGADPADPAAALQAVHAATRLAALTRTTALVPTVHAGHTEPGRLAAAVEALHTASGGRAGVHLRVPVPADEQGWVRAVRRRWSAGADGPLVALPGRPGRGRRALPAEADLALLTPDDAAAAGRLAAAAARSPEAPRHLLGDVVVVLEDSAERALDRAGSVPAAAATAPEGALVVAGTPAQLADLAQEWHAAGLAGLRLHPADPARDLPAVTRALVPELRRRGAVRRTPGAAGLRERLADVPDRRQRAA